jgi:hypothetical protein
MKITSDTPCLSSDPTMKYPHLCFFIHNYYCPHMNYANMFVNNTFHHRTQHFRSFPVFDLRGILPLYYEIPV